jgi:hypothetical protein
VVGAAPSGTVTVGLPSGGTTGVVGEQSRTGAVVVVVVACVPGGTVRVGEATSSPLHAEAARTRATAPTIRRTRRDIDSLSPTVVGRAAAFGEEGGAAGATR